MRRAPHLILDPVELRHAVAEIRQHDIVTIDIETTKLSPRLNTLRWVGMGVPGRVFLVPVQHPKGLLLKPERKVKTTKCAEYPPPDPRGMTPGGKPSNATIEVLRPAEYAPPPDQMFADEVCSLIKPILFSTRIAKLGHNVKFDLESLSKYFDDEIPPPPYHDTLILRHILNEDHISYSLKELTCNRYKIPRKERATFYPPLGELGTDNFALDVVARYLAKDLRYAWLSFCNDWPRLRELQDAYDFEMSIYPAIMAMEYAGFPVNLDEIDRVRDDLDTGIHAVEEEVWQRTGDSFSLSLTDKKRWVMFGEGKPLYGDHKRPLISQSLPVISRTPEAQVPQVTQGVLEAYQNTGNEVASLFLQWSELEKLRGTFIGSPDGGEDGKPTGIYRFLRPTRTLPTVHTSFKQHGTKTGRLSASEPNLQQLPKGETAGATIRELFVAGYGYVLIVADYDQIELRCAGYLSRDPKMLQVFQRGEDIHRRAASVMFQVLPEEVTDPQRNLGKTQNFAVLYGAGEERIAVVGHMSKKRARVMIRNYYEEFTELEPWKERVLREARDVGDRADPTRLPPYVAIPPFGRRRRLPDLFHPEFKPARAAERQAVNARVQGFAANISAP